MEQFRFSIFIGLPELTNHFNILSVMCCLRNVFATRLDKDVKLTSSFSTNKVFATLTCIVNTSSVGQKLPLEAEQPFKNSVLHRRVRDSSSTTHIRIHFAVHSSSIIIYFRIWNPGFDGKFGVFSFAFFHDPELGIHFWHDVWMWIWWGELFDRLFPIIWDRKKLGGRCGKKVDGSLGASLRNRYQGSCTSQCSTAVLTAIPHSCFYSSHVFIVVDAKWSCAVWSLLFWSSLASSRFHKEG